MASDILIDNTNIRNKNEKIENNISQEKQMAVESLRNRIHQDIKTVTNISTHEEFLLRWLYSTDFNIEVAIKRIKEYHENMIENPNWYCKESPLKRKSYFDANINFMIPGHDKEGRPIYLLKFGNLDPQKTSFADEACLEDIWFEYLLDKHPEITGQGVCMIFDLDGMSWKYLKMLSYKDVKLSFRRLASLPFREFIVHFVHSSRYTKAIYKMVQPFIPEESKKQLHFHFDNLNSLYDHVEKENLPPEYGGYNKINYKKINESLMEKDEVIANNFVLYRSVLKS